MPANLPPQASRLPQDRRSRRRGRGGPQCSKIRQAFRPVGWGVGQWSCRSIRPSTTSGSSAATIRACSRARHRMHDLHRSEQCGQCELYSPPTSTRWQCSWPKRQARPKRGARSSGRASQWASTKVAIKTNAIQGATGNHPRVAIIKKICDVFIDQLGVPAANIILYDANSSAATTYSTYASPTDATKIRATVSDSRQNHWAAWCRSPLPAPRNPSQPSLTLSMASSTSWWILPR
jgi:hypothetical protein